MITGRFAPSPTGDLHLGNLRTALAAWHAARSRGGRFLVRFEDLDRVTASRGIATGQMRDLAALGIDWDDEPVFQSDRFDLYDRAIDTLEASGVTYECFCTRKEIREAALAPHGASSVYPGTCRNLTDRERVVRRGERRGALRLDARAAGFTGPLGFTDRRAGANAYTVDDVVLRRNDGVPSYNVAVVVDDELQGVTQVVRGEDLLSITSTQVALQQLFGYRTPEYVHVPLVLGPDGERLAKRHGAVTLADLVEQGVGAAEIRARLMAEVRTWGLDGKS